MLGYDGTGPQGRGPMTGGGFGYCVTSLPGNGAGPQGARGNFSVYGRGRGRRNRYFATGFFGWQRTGPASWPGTAAGSASPTPAEEARHLNDHVRLLEQQLEDIRQRIRSLEGTDHKNEASSTT